MKFWKRLKTLKNDIFWTKGFFASFKISVSSLHNPSYNPALLLQAIFYSGPAKTGPTQKYQTGIIARYMKQYPIGKTVILTLSHWSIVKNDWKISFLYYYLYIATDRFPFLVKNKIKKCQITKKRPDWVIAAFSFFSVSFHFHKKI